MPTKIILAAVISLVLAGCAGSGDSSSSSSKSPSAIASDSDGDGVGNQKDNCPDVSNPDQEDLDKNGIGNACDPTFAMKIGLILNY